MDGVGVVPWTTFNRAMDKLSNGARDKEARAAAAIKYANELECFPFDEDYPITTLVRFLTQENMKLLGISDIFSTPPKLIVDESAVKERLCYIIREIGKDGDKDSRNLADVRSRRAWLNEILQKFPAGSTSIPVQTKTKSAPTHVQNNMPLQAPQQPQTQQSAQVHPVKHKKNRDPSARKYMLLPKEKYGIDIGKANEKTKSFYKELEKLDVDACPMLAAIGLRALLELATAQCEKEHGITPAKSAALPDRVKNCAKTMWGNSDNRTSAIANTVSPEHYLSLKALNQVDTSGNWAFRAEYDSLR